MLLAVLLLLGAAVCFISGSPQTAAEAERQNLEWQSFHFANQLYYETHDPRFQQMASEASLPRSGLFVSVCCFSD
jgi:hypothetical protein